MDIERLKKIDDLKTKMLKYIIFKKRTEKEVRQKFSNEDSEILEENIETLKELGYINDETYIDKFVEEAIALKNLSIYELKYKLLSKGISNSDIEQYFDSNMERLLEYERKSAENLINKKKKNMDIEEVKLYLRKKGYNSDILANID